MAHVLKTSTTDSRLALLKEMHSFGGAAQTDGLSADVIRSFLDEGYDELGIAIDRAYDYFIGLRETHPDFLALDEATQIKTAQEGITNFYAKDTVNPYVSAAADGPWIVSVKGAVIYDCGGYGMLGAGHSPETILEAMNRPHVMANIMTANVSQMDFIQRLRKEIGRSRANGTPYESFLCLNSGSEAMTLASRLSDANTKLETDPGARHEGHTVRGLTLKGSFHGRTERPARFSDSCAKQYEAHLASFRETEYLLKVEPNNIDALDAIFAHAENNDIFIEAFFMEPVMGEGNPGMGVTPEFYSRARALTKKHGSMLVVDSIQAGLRAQGVLSIVDYPGFADVEAPDMESYSKALNAGQYPLSVLALNKRAADIYQQGLYGNTMTSNPRALDVAIAVLDSFTEERRENIRVRGQELVDGMAALAPQTDNGITSAQGTGLLLSCALADRYKTYGANSTEDYLRRNGLGVIHGGAHSLRFTPIFDITSKEVKLILALVKDALLNGPTQI